MKFGCRPWLLLLAFLLVPAAAQAQQREHGRRPYVAITPEGDFEKVLQENVERLKGLENLRGILDRLRAHKDLLKNNPFFNEKMLEKLTRDFDLNNPDNRKLLNKFLDQAQKDPSWLEEMKKQIPDLGKELPDLRDKKKVEEFKKLIETEQEKPEGGGEAAQTKPQGGGPPVGGVPQPPRQQPAPPAAPEEADDDFTETLRGWLDRMKNWKGVGDVIEDSPAIQSAIEDFTLSLMNDSGGPQLDTDWLDGAGHLADYAEKGWSAFGSSLADLGNIKFDPLPSIRLPSLGSMPAFHVPSLGGAPAPGGGSLSFLRYLVWVVMLGAFALIIWQLWTRYATSAHAERAAAGWRLGAWPVDPAKVANGRELIAAFEYLSLLKLGQAAETWNHRDIAVNLAGAEAGSEMGTDPLNSGGPSPFPTPLADRRTAADRLAGLYEQARYAPDHGPLPPQALAEARRDLCYLAGVSAA
jgi:hypothetical protein